MRPVVPPKVAGQDSACKCGADVFDGTPPENLTQVCRSWGPRIASAPSGNVRPPGPVICEDQWVRTPLPPVAAVIGFIDAINRGDADRLAALMSSDHQLQVHRESPVTGREANRDAWDGYVTAFPDYVIYPDHIVDQGDDVLVLAVRPVPTSAFLIRQNASSE
jgi:hypothetical protein